MLKVLTFVDGSNIMGQCRHVGRRADFPELVKLLADPEEGRFSIDAFVYLPLPHSNGDGVHRFHDHLRSRGLQVISKRMKQLPDGSYKCDMDAELIMDALEMARDTSPDIIVLASGDGDLAPLALRLRRRGIRVEVASNEQGLASELRLAAQGFIDLSQWLDRCERVAEDAPAIGNENVFANRL